LRLSGKKVREGREQLALSVDDASEGAGVSPHTWLRAEHGGELRPTSVRRIASYLGASPAELMEKDRPKIQTLPKHKSWEEAQADVLTRQQDIEAKVEEWEQMDTPLGEVNPYEVKAVLDDAKDCERNLMLALPGSQSSGPNKVSANLFEIEQYQLNALGEAKYFYEQLIERLESIGLVRIVEEQGRKAEAIAVGVGG